MNKSSYRQMLRIMLVLSLLPATWLPALAAVETETNNTELTADALPAGELISGNLSSEDDIDYFSFSISNSDTLEIVFAAPTVSESGSQWLVLIQRATDGIVIFQEVFSPTASASVERTIGIGNGSYFVVVRSAGGASPTPSAVYNLTVTPNNFAPVVGEIAGVWHDPMDNRFYSIHETSEGLLYIQLNTEPLEWTAFLGNRSGNRAELALVLGAGSATLELQFTSATSYEARYLDCTTAEGTACAETPGALLYTATRVFGN